VRRLADLVRRKFGGSTTLDLTEADRRAPESQEAGQGSAPADTPAERRKRQQLAREIGQVADYVARLKREIGSLKAGEVYSKRLPETVTDLKSVHVTTKAATETIMAAAEAILAHDASDPSYQGFVLERVMEIMQACSFEDIAGQRIDRATDTLLDVERRLERFAKAVKIADAADLFDRRSIMREARREVLMVEGPQNAGQAIEQEAIDKLFD
jgi:chemotaxis protein CheZ